MKWTRLAADRRDLRKSAGRTLINPVSGGDGRERARRTMVCLILGATNAPVAYRSGLPPTRTFRPRTLLPPPDETGAGGDSWKYWLAASRFRK